MAATQTVCPVCTDPAASKKPLFPSLAVEVTCPTCGVCQIGGVTERVLQGSHHTQEDRWRLSWAIRRATEAGTILRLRDSDLKPTIESVPEPDTLEKVDLLLRHLAQRSGTFGELVKIDLQHDWPIVFARGKEEFENLLTALVAQDYVYRAEGSVARVKLQGLQRLKQLRKVQPDTDRAFVAMWFDPSITPAWDEAFRPTLEDLGYKPIRVDREEYLGKIDDFIIASIRDSGLLIADFTGHRSGVYFETGFAMGLGIPVIFTCREDQISGAHFDTRQYNHLGWRDTTDLSAKLRARIEATIPSRPRRR